MRALLAREGELGLTTLAGEIESARAVAVEVLVTVLDDLALERSLDPAGVVSPSSPSRARSARIENAGSPPD
jgi:hypothetical protein